MKKVQDVKLAEPNICRREQRYFSEAARRAIVEEIEKGLSKAEAARRYEVSVSIIYVWIAKYSKFYRPKLRQVVEHESDSLKLKKLEDELERTYALLGREKARGLYLETVIEQADAALGMDLKKNFDAPRLRVCVPKKTRAN